MPGQAFDAENEPEQIEGLWPIDLLMIRHLCLSRWRAGRAKSTFLPVLPWRTIPHLSGLGLWEQSNRFAVNFAVNDALRQKWKRPQERLE
ncbi:hypothetical protein KSC_004550 [Ktedonobacter sp. SOSP1-52]|uniref:hypothetical protein n=1 Tax=Ktedonobacter sp. SOSP1-52 TaxID=2778366 RepID=UPI001916AEDE|nr:hypothetical protein [Ktedonobacter sp. SOSP1-52]GHO61563.1 hypothetical protein KSC_004550 [Ktedonobacter sp. SOSP1-52]